LAVLQSGAHSRHRRQLRSLAEQAVKENQSHILYLEALLALECEERDRHAIENRILHQELQEPGFFCIRLPNLQPVSMFHQ
jgi:DNA replication protein DnaC